MPDVLEKIKKAVLEGEDEYAISLTQEALSKGISPDDILNRATILGIQEAGDLWKRNIYFQPDIVMCAEAFRAVMGIIGPHVSDNRERTIGKFIIGTVAGDMHNLGKLIVVAMLQSAGFIVQDLGEDVPCDLFIDSVKTNKPDILGLGCYMTTTMKEMKYVIEQLKNQGLRDDVKIIIGGIPTTQSFADEIRADSWGKDALDAMEKAKELIDTRIETK